MTQKILVVDDEIVIAKDLEAMVVQFGYQVVGVACSGEEAVELSTQTDPDLVLTDLSLKGDLDGIETASRIRYRLRAPIIFLTDYTDEATLERARVFEPDGYIVKPIRERELRLIIEAALYRHQKDRLEHELEDRFFAISIDLLCFLDFNGYFKRLNPAWERTLGFTCEELMSKPFIEFVHPEDRERTLNKNKEVRSGGQAILFENRYMCKDGSYRWFLWNAAPDFGQQVIYSVARDITERKQAEEEREDLVRKLQTALAEVKTLRDILPICSYCKNIRNDENYWQTVETYISTYTKTQFTHSICPNCYEKEVQPQLKRFCDSLMDHRSGNDLRG